jgi:uncharacterized membrane protein YgcG
MVREATPTTETRSRLISSAVRHINGTVTSTRCAEPQIRVRKAPPKPTDPACAFCDSGYWRYNGTAWYVADRITKKRHFCTSPLAVAMREADELGRVEQARVRAKVARRHRRFAAFFKVAASVAYVAFLAVLWTDGSSNRANYGSGGGGSGSSYSGSGGSYSSGSGGSYSGGRGGSLDPAPPRAPSSESRSPISNGQGKADAGVVSKASLAPAAVCADGWDQSCGSSPGRM